MIMLMTRVVKNTWLLQTNANKKLKHSEALLRPKRETILAQ